MSSRLHAMSCGKGDAVGSEAGGWAESARHAVVKVDHARGERARLDKLEIHSSFALGKVRDATTHQRGVDHHPILVDETQLGHLGRERRAADRDLALPRLRT